MGIIKSFTLIILIGIATVGLTVTTAMATVVTLPTGLNPGDQYRLAFVTRAVRDATSTDIGVYNDFVDAVANSNAALLALALAWKAIASTPSIDARDNTDTNPSSTGVSIFLLDGTLLASDNAELWGGTLQRRFNLDENNTEITSGTAFVWTGTDITGVEHSDSRGLGTFNPNPIFGALTSTSGNWIAFGSDPTSVEYHLYGISETLTVAAVIPLPAALPLFLTGLAGLALIRRRRRRA